MKKIRWLKKDRILSYIFYTGVCPKCKKGYIEFGRNEYDNGVIIVNCETLGKVCIPSLFNLKSSCRNPVCEWSKVNETP